MCSVFSISIGPARWSNRKRFLSPSLMTSVWFMQTYMVENVNWLQQVLFPLTFTCTPIVNTHTHVYTQSFLYVNKSLLFQKIDLLKLVMILWHFIFLLSPFLSVSKSYKQISISLHKTIKKKEAQLESVSHIFYWYLYLSGEGFLLL